LFPATLASASTKAPVRAAQARCGAGMSDSVRGSAAGRRVTATKALAPGDLVCEERSALPPWCPQSWGGGSAPAVRNPCSAFAYMVRTPFLQSACHFCLKDVSHTRQRPAASARADPAHAQGEMTKLCPCSFCHYCSQDCLDADEARHKIEVRARAWAPPVSSANAARRAAQCGSMHKIITVCEENKADVDLVRLVLRVYMARSVSHWLRGGR
jgi:hypothetical protein